MNEISEGGSSASSQPEVGRQALGEYVVAEVAHRYLYDAEFAAVVYRAVEIAAQDFHGNVSRAERHLMTLAAGAAVIVQESQAAARSDGSDG